MPDNGKGICVDSDGSIFLMDPYNYRILKYTTSDGMDYTVSLEWGSKGSENGQFDWGYNANLVMDENNHIYVPDYNNKRVQVFDTNGNYLNSIYGNALFQAYISLAIDINSNILYILDSYNNQIHMFTLEGNYYTTIRNDYIQDGLKMRYPGNIFYSNGKIYVLDYNNSLATYSNNRILILEL
jgi:sugar lactone lactonase YvrE